jgi:peroxiredoxin
MRKLALLLVMAAAIVTLFAAARRCAARHGIIAVSIAGNQGLPLAPQLTITDLDGKTFNTSTLKGQVVVVNFWAAWCTPCAEEVPKFVALQRKYQAQGLQIIGISIDDDDSELRAVYRRSNMNYPVVAGSQQIAQAYGGILGLPTTFIIGRDSRIQKKLTGSTDFAALEKDVAALVGSESKHAEGIRN